jgi:hypothetical protein
MRRLFFVFVCIGWLLPFLYVTRPVEAQYPSGARRLIREELTRYGILVNGSYSGDTSYTDAVSIVTDNQSPGAFRVAWANGRDRVRVPTGGTNIALILGDEDSGVGDSELIEFRGYDSAGGIGNVLCSYHNVGPVKPDQYRIRYGGIDDLVAYSKYWIGDDPYPGLFSLYFATPAVGPRWTDTPTERYRFSQDGFVIKNNGTNTVTLSVRLNGSNKNELIATFPTGSAQVIATEP